MAVHHGCSLQDVVGGIGGVRLEFGFHRSFADEGLSGQRGFVDLKGNGIQKNAVRRDFLPGVQNDHVSNHHVAARNFADIAAADGLHHRVVVDLVQDFKFFVGAYLKSKAYAGGQQNGHQNADRFQKDACRFRPGEKLVTGHAYGQDQGYEEYLDDGVGEFFQKLLPQRFFFRGSQDIDAVFVTVFQNLLFREPLVMCCILHVRNACLPDSAPGWKYIGRFEGTMTRVFTAQAPPPGIF